MSTALILFAHGARDPEWARPLLQIQARVREDYPAAMVRLAFLEFMAPDLTTVVADLVCEGVSRIVVVPMFIAQGGHLKRELPAMLSALRSTYPGIDISLTGPIGEHAAVLAAMADGAAALAGFSPQG